MFQTREMKKNLRIILKQVVDIIDTLSITNFVVFLSLEKNHKSLSSSGL